MLDHSAPARQRRSMTAGGTDFAGMRVLLAEDEFLIALAVAVTTRCDSCIANHAKKAIELGVTEAEMAEALGVAVAMNAGAALAYSGRAMDAFREFSAGD